MTDLLKHQAQQGTHIMDYIKIHTMPEDWLIPDEDGDTTDLQLDVEYYAADKGEYYRIYTPEDANIPKKYVTVTERDA
mgnify:FL=1